MNRDSKGPEGKGPMTGRGLGRCKKIADIEPEVEFGKGLCKEKCLRRGRR